MKIKNLLIALAMALTPALVSAQTIYTDTSTHLTYTLSGNSASIGGVAAGYTLSGQLVIPSNVTDGTHPGIVTYIGTAAFANNTGITSLDLSQATGLTTIYSSAFLNCPNLTGDLTIPDGVTTIGAAAFSDCLGLNALTLPSSIESIGNAAFEGCTGFTGTLTLPSGLMSIGARTFYGCSGFTGALTIPNSVTSIGTNAFNSCSGFNALTLSNSLTKIDNYIFNGCSGFTGELVIPSGVTLIGDHTFSGCSGFTGELSIPNGATSIATSAFYKCSGLTGDLDLSQLNLPNISSYSFAGCTGLDGKLTLPNGITSIDAAAFYTCPFTNNDLEIPSSVNRIGMQAFSGCTGLTGNIVIPASVTEIDSVAFYSCGGLRSFTFEGKTLDMANMQGRVFALCTQLEYIDMSACALGSVPAYGVSRVVPSSTFYGTSSHTLIYLPQDGSGKLTMPSAPDNENYVLDGVCDLLVVEDATDYYIPHAFTATIAQHAANNNNSYMATATKRTFTQNAATVYLPYTFTLPDEANIKGYALWGKRNHEPGNAGDNTFVFTQQEESFQYQANTPYIIKYVGGDNFLPDAKNAIVPATSGSVGRVIYDADNVSGAYDGTTTAKDNHNGTTISDPVSGEWTFCGTTEVLTPGLVTSENWKTYVLSGNMWHQAANGVGASRAFIVGSSDTPLTAKAFELRDLDGSVSTPTGIDVITSGYPSSSVKTPIYNVSGQYVGKDINALPKGLYVVDGKKVVK